MDWILESHLHYSLKQDHTIKKLLLIFWEVVPKTTPDGKLLQEFILVCDAYRKVGYCKYLKNIFICKYVEKDDLCLSIQPK